MNLHFYDWTPRVPSSSDLERAPAPQLSDPPNSSPDTKQTAKTMAEPSVIVFLHGLGGTGAIWRPIAAQLEDQIRCIAPDQRGHGKSRLAPHVDFTSALSQMTSIDYAKDVLELFERLQLSRIFLIGHSMGARTALACGHLLASRSPERLRERIVRIACIDIGLQGAWGGGMGRPLADFLSQLPETFESKSALRAYLQEHCPDPSIAQYLSAVAKNEPDAPSSAEKWRFPFDHSAVLNTIKQAQLPEPSLGERNSTRSLSKVADWALQITECGVPVHFLRGETSRVWSKEDYLRQKQALGSELFQFEEWPECGHGLPFEQRSRFIEWIQRWTRPTQ